LVPPAPVLLLLGATGMLPVPVLMVLLFQPVPVCPIFALIPLVVVAAIAIVIPMGVIVFGNSGEWGRKRHSQNEGTDITTHLCSPFTLKEAIDTPRCDRPRWHYV